MIWRDLAVWDGPTPNRTPGGMGEVRGLLLHIQQGSQSGSISWCLNPASQVSAHFFVAQGGTLVQLVDTDDAAWAEVDGNSSWISLECEGYSGDSLTPAQVATAGALMARIHQVYGVPLQVSDDPQATPGITGHGLGGAAYGGHYQCPGTPVLDQRPAVLMAAAALIDGGDVQLTDTVPVSPGFAARYPAAGPDGFTPNNPIPVATLLMGAAIRAANNEHLIAGLLARVQALEAKAGIS